ncbi:MAG: exopolysaccharide Pel transporter PelG [bacterium]
MAGIGFKLRKIFDFDSYVDNLRGILFAASISGGPIFFSILCLGLLSVYSRAFISSQDMKVFLVTIVYVFAFSLISTGLTQLLLTRYLSDLIYAKEIHRIIPTFCSALALTVTCQIIIGLPFMFFLELDFTYRLTSLMLFITIGCIWQIMIFLSAMKNYNIIFVAFIIGLSLSFLLAVKLGKSHGLTGFLHGYTFGQIVLLFILLARLFLEFQSTDKPDFAFIQYFKKMPQLALIGLFYNLGIWVDKIIFWFSSEGEQINSFLFAHTYYDGATFFAYLTVIPSYTYFLVKVETEFYGFFRAFYQTILDKNPFNEIREQKNKIAKSLRESFLGLIKIQGIVTLLCLLYSKEIASAFRIPVLGTLILEKAVIAVFLQMLLLTVMIFMMYFDIRTKLVQVVAVFLGSNIIFTIFTLKMGYIYYGYGYLLACLTALILGYYILNNHIKDLEYQTFVSQPLAG